MVSASSNNQHRAPSGPALGLRFLLLACLSILLLVIDQRQNYLDIARKAIGAFVYPLHVVVDAPISTWLWITESTATRNELQLENSRLRAERLLTNARLQKYAALEAENTRLRAMLEATPRSSDRIRVSEIMSVSANPFRHVVVVDKGTRDGVFDGQAMVDANGVVGQVIEAGLLSSQGILISDPDHALPVEVNRNGLRTIAVGSGEFARLDLPFLANNADIQEGDLLVTSGLGGAFPAGYPVAVVDAVKRIPQEPFASVSAIPSAALNQIREVMLIWPGIAAETDETASASEDAGDVDE
ncbi:MAG: rod shape-determining protein MreC [Gammaproteobacteria bacterium]|nr:rod shape-determining protein MreC [Gammaproteobacteria bacterium]MDH4315918.1 rod shape-determining protein MreC [Gammaproteobacteria bacterium]MDH5214138.1 rod shape-determining protein MreC [Gammaproteobacteria bacterium]MDH5500098.1 rod shape-determining protein MreC [Gammaproteobacteria bacterium]